MAVTVTFGTTAPLESFTVPEMAPPVPAQVAAAKIESAKLKNKQYSCGLQQHSATQTFSLPNIPAVIF
ncbi:MAG: hypothetical protein ABSH13_07485 [Candidatus Acidiferrum sp.]